MANRWPTMLLCTFLVVVIALGLHPRFREDWLLENLLVFVSVPLLVVTYRRLRFSNAAYTLMFVFFVLHEIGAHYTYSLVPYDAWIESLARTTLADSLGLTRNHYDRVIHFAYGLLLYLPILELLEARAPPRGLWRALMPVLFVLSNSALYELLEWAAAMVFGGDLGVAYLGTQGDVWDSQKDMACAAAGALLGAALVPPLRRRRHA
jgi:putative membrane protein